ncbi:UdgX family uracil-DNA binding protein [Candidatus Kirkpatrickella diaphorinae]|uniref:Type-4 uracil-DNA glycosylase n=1 Tax=Candidatus Kirkpatrickella diaphorinae TaxID=2984322 RepID=A0ABY6GLM1_9PROT|nr:UdgX family uracil-DNA binding protein [Candidatus Kirkpatrickella diaphorinae]UYH51698.1 UdgX family uracil-DNA binding protein [Candidatus Kirkpatrickella diaphorinae]
MFDVTLAHHDDFRSWRDATRKHVSAGVNSRNINWIVNPPDDLFQRQNLDSTEQNTSPFKITRQRYVQLQEAFHAQDSHRFETLYTFVMALHQQDDAQIAALTPKIEALIQAGRAAVLRFRESFVKLALSGGETAPDRSIQPVFDMRGHRIFTGQAATLTRMIPSPWVVSGDTVTIRWTGSALFFSRGGLKAQNEKFQPEIAFGSGYWAQLPQLRLPVKTIPSVIPDTPMTQHHAGASKAPEPNRESRFAQLRAHAVDCAACDLCDIGTRTVFGEGRLDAKIMLIGEQPGDQEDLSGRPFVGPAGALLDQNLREVGLERARLYVTNSVKHFRFVHRYGRRLHQKPDLIHIHQCHPWLSQEISLIAPTHIILLGASAASAMLGRPVTVNRERSRFFRLGNCEALITVHPSYLLRIQDRASQDFEKRRFLSDLRLVADATAQSETQLHPT